jgi:hypothetical protein
MEQKPRASGARASDVQLAGERSKPTEEHAKSQRKKPSRQERWRDRNPLAAWAHSALRSAVKRGIVVRRPCEVCGAEPADAHHADYSRPADVRFLCRRCHKAEHRAARRK